MADERALRVDCRMHGILRAAERDEERIALRADLKACVPRKGLAHQGTMRLQRVLVAVDAQRAQQSRRTFDVAHEEGDGAGGTQGGRGQWLRFARSEYY